MKIYFIKIKYIVLSKMEHYKDDLSKNISKQTLVSEFKTFRYSLNWDIISGRKFFTKEFANLHSYMPFNKTIVTRKGLPKTYGQYMRYIKVWDLNIVMNECSWVRRDHHKLNNDELFYCKWINIEIIRTNITEKWNWNALIINKVIDELFIDENYCYLRNKLDWDFISYISSEKLIIKYPNWKYNWNIISEKDWVTKDVYIKHKNWKWNIMIIVCKDWFDINDKNLID